MLAWLSANFATIFVGLIVLALVALALRSVLRSRKKGGCAGGCSGCSLAGTCHAGKPSGRERYDDFLNHAPPSA